MVGDSSSKKVKKQMSDSLLHTRRETKTDHSVAEPEPDSVYPHRLIGDQSSCPVRLDLNESGSASAGLDVHLCLARPGIPTELPVVIAFVLTELPHRASSAVTGVMPQRCRVVDRV